MIEFIISILVPILGGLGVSEADVTTYVTNCSGYIYAILISILVLIVLLVAAHFIAPKGKRHLVRWGASLAWVLALVTMVNMVCYGPLYTNLSVVLNGGGTVSDEAKAASNEVIKKVGEEGMVLVKNNGLLPLSSDVDSMNVFGWASTNPIYGGTGSGSADTSSVVSILQSLSDAGYKTNESLTKMYTDYRADRPAATILGGDGSFDITLPEPTADYYTDDVMGEAESFSDVAMVVISRGGGEGYDLPTDMNSVIHGTYNVADEVSVNPANYAYTNISYTNNGDYDDFDAGESYLELSNTEEAMLDKVCSEFSKVIVVINANNPMELDWVDNYDSIGAVILAPGTGQTGGGYILEAGEYTVSVRSDSHTVLDQANFTVDSDINYSENARTTDNVAATNQLNDYTAGNVTYLSRADGFANYAEATAAPAEEAYVMDDATRKEVEANSTVYYDSTAYDNAEDTMPTLGSDNGLTLADLTGKAYDDPMWDQLLDQMSFEDMSLLVNLGGWQTAQIDSVGKVATSDCDGPAGVNNFITGTYGTPYPTEVLMAQTWNTDLLYDLGLAMGQEYADVNNYGVYGPAMNTHRSAFAGRNFEYYSEDGVLAGKLAAAQVNAMATKGTYNYIKHFALNDQETNRCAFLLTYSNEQAIREIYLKPFELCIKNFDGTQIAVMSSFNWIGTVPACANEDTLTTILRNEWGFQGMVITDYDGSYGYMITDHCVRTGNDLMLGFSSQASNQLTNTESATLNNALRTSCKNIMYTIANSGYYTNTTDDSGMSNMTKLFVTIDVVTVLLVVLCMALVIVRYRKKHAKTTAEVTPEEKKEE